MFVFVASLLMMVSQGLAGSRENFMCIDQSGTFQGDRYCRAVRYTPYAERVIYGDRQSAVWDRVIVIGIFEGRLRYRGYICGYSFYIVMNKKEEILNQPKPLRDKNCVDHPVVGHLFAPSGSKISIGDSLQFQSRSDVVSETSERSSEWVWPSEMHVVTQVFKGNDHTGIDIDGNILTHNFAVASGLVTFAGWKGGYGLTVEILHSNGLVTRYAHHSSIKVHVGQRVRGGQIIGFVGATGNVRGPYGTHLHFEFIEQGRFIDPMTILSSQR